MSVLLVDDDEVITSGLALLLEEHEIPVCIAGDRESAEALICEQFFPLVLADLRLRDENDGVRLIEAVRQLSPRTKVAAMTGYPSVEVERELRDLGAAAVLRKPFPLDEFIDLIRQLLADAGEPHDLAAIYTATTPRLRAMLSRRFRLSLSDCDDVLQQAWCVLLEKQHEVRDAGAWLAGTVCNVARQLIDRRAHEYDLDSLPDNVCVVDRDLVASIAMRDAIAELDERSRILCEAVGVARLSYAEAGELLQLPVGSVGPMFIRAKKKLRAALTQ